MNKSEVHEKVRAALGNDEFAKLWWGLELPGLGMARPRDVWEKEPERIVQYVKDYTAVE